MLSVKRVTMDEAERQALKQKLFFWLSDKRDSTKVDIKDKTTVIPSLHHENYEGLEI